MNKILTNIEDSINLANIPALQGNGKVYDGITTYDVIENWNQWEYTQPVTIFFVMDIKTLKVCNFLTSIVSTVNKNFFATALIVDQILYSYLADYTTIAIGQIEQSVITVKKGLTAFAFVLNANANNCTMITNGVKSSKTTIVNNMSGSIINPIKRLALGTDLDFSSKIHAVMKKLQIVNVAMTPAQLNRAFNEYTLEGIIADGNFLLDVDFNKTTGNPLTTRAGTPTYTITPYGSNVFAPFL